MKSIITLFLSFLVYALPAQVMLCAWEVNGLSSFGPSPFQATYISAGIHVDSLQRGPGIGTSGTAASNAWGGNNLTEQGDSAAALVGDWVQFGLRADSGYVLSLSEISAYNVRRSSTGADSGLWQYKVGLGNWTNIGNPIYWGTNTTASGNSQGALSLVSYSDLQKVPADTMVWFRLLLWGASGSSGTWYINNQTGFDLQIMGDTHVSSLPVTWLYTRIRTETDFSFIEWATAQEINNSHFDIEEAGSDGFFYPIGRLEGAGNSNENLQYSFSLNTHPSPRYYRIRQNDYDGKFEYSPIMSLQNKASNHAFSFKCWPNPVSHELHVLSTDTDTAILMNVYNMNGVFHSTQIIQSGLNRINVSHLPEGVYWFEIVAKGKEPEVHKIILRRD